MLNSDDRGGIGFPLDKNRGILFGNFHSFKNIAVSLCFPKMYYRPLCWEKKGLHVGALPLLGTLYASKGPGAVPIIVKL